MVWLSLLALAYPSKRLLSLDVAEIKSRLDAASIAWHFERLAFVKIGTDPRLDAANMRRGKARLRNSTTLFNPYAI